MDFRSSVWILLLLLAMVLITACTYDDFNAMYPHFAEAEAKCNAVNIEVSSFTIEPPSSISAGRINLTVEILKGHEYVEVIRIVGGVWYQNKSVGDEDSFAFNTTFIGPAPDVVTLSEDFLWSDFMGVNQCIAGEDCKFNLTEIFAVEYLVRIYSGEARRIYGENLPEGDTTNSTWAKQHNVTGELLPCAYVKRLSTKTLNVIDG